MSLESQAAKLKFNIFFHLSRKIILVKNAQNYQCKQAGGITDIKSP